MRSSLSAAAAVRNEKQKPRCGGTAVLPLAPLGGRAGRVPRALGRVHADRRRGGTTAPAVGLLPLPGRHPPLIVGAGDRPCAILMIGARPEVETLRYPVSKVAAKYGASRREGDRRTGRGVRRLAGRVPAGAPSVAAQLGHEGVEVARSLSPWQRVPYPRNWVARRSQRRTRYDTTRRQAVSWTFLRPSTIRSSPNSNALTSWWAPSLKCWWACSWRYGYASGVIVVANFASKFETSSAV
jgi:hypothetical protein